MRRFQGRCHCGAVRCVTDSDLPALTTCDCSVCRRKNAVVVKVHAPNFTLLAGADALTAYRFHSHTATHYFCRQCGATPSTASASRPTITASTFFAWTALMPLASRFTPPLALPCPALP